MADIIPFPERATALRYDSPDCPGYARPPRGTGFAYCPEPDVATERAYRDACPDVIYTPEVILMATLGVIGAAWIIGAGLMAIFAGRPQ